MPTVPDALRVRQAGVVGARADKAIVSVLLEDVCRPSERLAESVGRAARALTRSPWVHVTSSCHLRVVGIACAPIHCDLGGSAHAVEPTLGFERVAAAQTSPCHQLPAA